LHSELKNEKSISSIVETSIQRPLLIVVIFTILALGGIVSYNLLNLTLLPGMDLPTLTVITAYPGAGGISGARTGNSSKNNAATISVKMVDKDKRAMDVYDFSQRIKNEIMQKIPGVHARVSVANIGGVGGSEPIQLIVQGAAFMAWVIIGGLTSSMMLTLVVVPVVYMGFYRVKARIGKKHVVEY
jgi:multidrug efflux pump subunit AcrB